MAKDPAFLFYPGDYLRDTQNLSSNSQVVYDRIMCEHMRNICITQQQLKFFTKRLSPDDVEELMHVLTKVSGGFQISWVAESINKRKAYSESRRTNRSRKVKEDMIIISETYDNHMENENENENENINEGANDNESENCEVLIFPTFDDFWNLYDKKVDRTKCERKWSKVKQFDKEALIHYLPEYVRLTPDKTYRKNPITFLNNRSWENDLPNENRQNGKPGMSLTEQILREDYPERFNK